MLLRHGFLLLPLLLLQWGCTTVQTNNEGLPQAVEVIDLREQGIEIRGQIDESGAIIVNQPERLYRNVMGSIELVDLRAKILDNGFHRLQFSVRNAGPKDEQFRWRAVWLDEDGFEMNAGTQGWFPVTVATKEVRVLMITSPAPDAGGFRIFIRKAP